MSSLIPDSIISHYRIKEMIGRGGMGEIYKAVDTQLGRVVAFKTLSPALTADQNANQRFLREARAASILDHPSICTVFEVGKEGDLVFIAMQYLQGQTIDEILAQGPLPIETAVSYALNVAEALEEAHKNGVIHRDIKPSNIIVNDRGIAVVLDFGLAKQVAHLEGMSGDSPTMMQVTMAAAIVGTPQYMSPEQIRGEAVDARSDIFSLGATLYEMLGGVRPFSGRSQIEAMHAVLHEEPKPLSEVRREVSGELERIVARALKKEPGARYDSASELRLELAEYMQSKGLQIGSASTRPAAAGSSATIKTRILPTGSFASTTARILSPRIHLPVAVIFLMAVGVAGAIWWLLARTHDETQTDFLSSLKFVQLANWKNEVLENIESAVSRDGRLIAVSAKGGGVSDLWIKQTIGGDPNPIQITKGEWSNWNPIFSPDGSQLAFKSNRGKQFGIWRMPAFGGTPTLLKQVDTDQFRLKYWSNDGHTIYYLYHYGSSLDTDLFALNTTSGDTKLVAHFNQRILFLTMSPGEDRIAYAAEKDGQADIWVMLVSTGAPTQITNDPEQDLNPVWLPDGKRIVYSSDRDGTYQICVAYLDGRKPQQITFGETNVFVLDVSADGAKILYKNLKEESDIWAARLDAGSELNLVSDISVKIWPDVSPDGKAIAYQSIRELGNAANLEKCRILTRPIATEGQQTQLAADGIQPVWSPDGEHVAFLRKSKDQKWNLWTVRASGGDERQLTTAGLTTGYVTDPYNRVQPKDYCWSLDSKRIVYCTVSEPSVRMVAVDGSGEDITLAPTNLDLIFFGPVFSPDARLVAYLSRTRVPPADGKNIWSTWVADTRTGKSEITFQKDSFLRLLGWSGDNLVVGTPDADAYRDPRGITFVQVSATGGAKHDIAHVTSAYLYNSFLSPEGRFIAVPLREDGKDNVWLIPVSGGKGRRITSTNDSKLFFSGMAWSPDGKTIYYGKQSTRTLISMIENFR